MNRFNKKQTLLFPPEVVFQLKPLHKYEILFSFLNTSPFHQLYAPTGRPPVPYEALLHALIYKNLKTLPSLSDVVRDIHDNPNLALMLGFHPLHLPCVENFSAFLQNTSHALLRKVKDHLLSELISLNEIKGTYLSFDSCNILARVKENNLKTAVRNRFDKRRVPQGDPDCRLGVMIHFPQPFQREIRYFWGYKNFALSDALSELPIAEETKRANVVDSKVIIPQLESVKSKFNLTILGVIADSALDWSNVLSFIVNELHAIPYIARNPRKGKDPHIKTSSAGKRICIAGFEMVYWGKFKDRNRTRLKFVCPIIHSKAFREKHRFCPWMHPQFTKGTGCFAYTQVLDEDIRSKIDYSSSHFKKIYNLRTSSERIFSRLLNLCMQNPTVKGFNAVSNHCTIAHITVLLIALSAIKIGNRDKIRFVKSFITTI